MCKLLDNNLDAIASKNPMLLIWDEVKAICEAIISGYYGAPDRCIRDKVWSHVRRPEGEPDKLYDLMNDPGETIDLIDKCPREA